MITAEQLRELLDYDQETGVFRWKARRCGVTVGMVAGRPNASGHWQIKIDGRMHMAHRLAWFLTFGRWPPNLMDHINGKPDDNRIENLREASRSLNRENQRIPQCNNKLGLLGVCREAGRFRAQITVRGKKIYLGVFDLPEEAHAVYLAAKREFHDGCTI